jgi:hypothetical protein
MVALALATHTALYPALLLPPLLLILQRSARPSATARIADLLAFGTAYAAVAGLNTWVFGWTWADATLGVM